MVTEIYRHQFNLQNGTMDESFNLCWLRIYEIDGGGITTSIK